MQKIVTSTVVNAYFGNYCPLTLIFSILMMLEKLKVKIIFCLNFTEYFQCPGFNLESVCDVVCFSKIFSLSYILFEMA
jgi:hypothetical protein